MADEALSGQAGGQASQPDARQAEQQKGGPGQGQAGDDRGRQAAGQDGRQIKPIPPRQSGKPAQRPAMPAQDLGFERNTPDADIAEFLEPGGQKRDPMTGRFMPSIADEMAAAAEAERRQTSVDEPEVEPEPKKEAKPAEQKPSEKPPLPTAADPSQQKLLYRGKEVTIAEIEQRHKSLEGQFGNLREERDYGYRSGHAWKAVADQAHARIAQLEQQLAQPGSGRSGAGAAAGTQVAAGHVSGEVPTVDQVLAEIDFNRFEQAALQEKDGGLPAAGKQLASDILRVVLDKVVPVLRAQQEATLEPFQEMQAGEELAGVAEGLVQQYVSYKNPDGSLAFPEFSDPDTLHEISATWVNSGGSPEDALTASGMLRALMNYRSIKQMLALGINPAATSTPGNGGADASPAPALAASVPGDTRGGHQPPNSGRSSQDPATRRFVNALTKADLVDPVLGFRKNPAGSHIGARE